MKTENVLKEKKLNTKDSKAVKSPEEGKEKRGIKKNQIIIAALTLMLGIAGYINLTTNTVDLSDGSKDSDNTEAAFAEKDIYDEAGELVVEDVEGDEITLNSDENSIGEAVLTNASTANKSVAGLKLNREQVRSKSKEYYLDIINGDDMDETAVNQAKDAYLKLTEDMEKEEEAETLLVAKGFVNPIVSIGEESVDVVVEKEELTSEEKAQIEDIILRKTGCTIDKVVITTYAK